MNNTEHTKSFTSALFTIGLLGSLIVAVISCGPSKEEMEAHERDASKTKIMDNYDIIII